jgi:flagellar motor switch/type III secretory pathway protein FliN
MSLKGRAWLPDSAMTDGVLCMNLTEQAIDWSQRWFGSAPGVLVRFRTNADAIRSPMGAASWETACQRLNLTLERPGQLRIAAAMLKLKLKQVKSKLADPDVRLLRDLAGACIEDLIQRASGVFSLDKNVRKAAEQFSDTMGADCVWYSISIGAIGRSLDLRIDHDAVIAARKSLILGEARTLPALGRREDAVARQSIRVGARIGSGSIGLVELSSLARGDVLVLDAGLGDRLDLTINGVVEAGAACELKQDGADLGLRLSI